METMVTANVRSMVNKREEIAMCIAENKPDVVALTETWLTEEVADSDIAIDGYNMCRLDRSESRYGGVLLYARKDIQLTEMSIQHTVGIKCETLVCLAKLPHGPSYIIVVVYRSPNNMDPRWMHSIRQFSRHPGLIITGDFNFPHINWETYSWSGPATSQEALFLQWLEENQLIQHVLDPTRIYPGQSPSILDLVITNSSLPAALISVCEPIATSDHNIVVAHFGGHKPSLAKP